MAFLRVALCKAAWGTGASVSPKMQLKHGVCSLTLCFYGLIGFKTSLCWSFVRFCCYEPEYALGNSVEWLWRCVSLETVLVSICIKLFCGAWERPKPWITQPWRLGEKTSGLRHTFTSSLTQSKSAWPLGQSCSLLFFPSLSFHLGHSLPLSLCPQQLSHSVQWTESGRCSGWKTSGKKWLYDGSSSSKL